MAKDKSTKNGNGGNGRRKIINGALELAKLVCSYSLLDQDLICSPCVELNEEAEPKLNGHRVGTEYVLKVRDGLFFPASIICPEIGELHCFKNCRGNWTNRMKEVFVRLAAKRVGYDEMYEYYTVGVPPENKGGK